MKRYRIQLRGENFLLDMDGEHGKFGFCVSRVIKAETREEAERIALIRIHQELNRYAPIVKNTPDAPRIILEQVKELKFYNLSRGEQSGRFEFVSEEPTEQ